MGPVEVVQQQVDAYMNGDIEAFLACYSSDAVIRDGDGNVLMTGLDQIRQQYAPFFTANPDLCVEILNRMQTGWWVVDFEHVTYGSEDLHAIVGYRVREDLIHAVVMMAANSQASA